MKKDNELKKKLVKKGVAVLVAGTLITTVFAGCTHKQLDVPSTNKAYVKFVEDNAVVFLESDGYRGYVSLFNRGQPYVLHENMDNEVYISGDLSSLVYVDKEDLENQLRAFVGDDGTITYYGDYDDEAINTFSKR